MITLPRMPLYELMRLRVSSTRDRSPIAPAVRLRLPGSPQRNNRSWTDCTDSQAEQQSSPDVTMCGCLIGFSARKRPAAGVFFPAYAHTALATLN